MAGGQIQEMLPVYRQDTPATVQAVSRTIESNDLAAGGTHILLFGSPADAEQTCMLVRESSGAAKLAGIGEEATAVVSESGIVVYFVRCRAVAIVEIRWGDLDTVSTYARRLDKRLSNAVCS